MLAVATRDCGVDEDGLRRDEIQKISLDWARPMVSSTDAVVACGGGVDIAFTVSGDGPAVLLIHGFPDDRMLWRVQADALAADGHTVGVDSVDVPPDTGATTCPDERWPSSLFHQLGLQQLERAWYMQFFQAVDVAAEWLSADDWANFRMWGTSSKTS